MKTAKLALFLTLISPYSGKPFILKLLLVKFFSGSVVMELASFSQTSSPSGRRRNTALITDSGISVINSGKSISLMTITPLSPNRQ